MKVQTAQLIDAARLRFGFLSTADVAELAADPSTRLMPLLVRCGGCRFTAGAQDIAHLVRCIEAGGDYVRDVSIPAGFVTARGHR
jgi:hypothetical protein